LNFWAASAVTGEKGPQKKGTDDIISRGFFREGENTRYLKIRKRTAHGVKVQGEPWGGEERNPKEAWIGGGVTTNSLGPSNAAQRENWVFLERMEPSVTTFGGGGGGQVGKLRQSPTTGRKKCGNKPLREKIQGGVLSLAKKNPLWSEV